MLRSSMDTIGSTFMGLKMALKVLLRDWGGLKISFGSYQNGLRVVNWSHRSCILAVSLLEKVQFRPLKVIS